MSAADRIAAIDALPARELCAQAMRTLSELVKIMNSETLLLRAGKLHDAATLSADKTQLAQDYMGLARAVQRQAERVQREAPDAAAALKAGHEQLATQMAENLKVLATARNVTEDLLTDVATAMSARERPKTYGIGGTVQAPANGAPSLGVAINRAL